MESLTALKKLSDPELIGSLKNLITKERAVLTEILHHLKEVENRKLHLAQGYSSLFAYLTEGLGYSEAAAQRRLQSMRLIQSVPEVEQKLESGELSLSVASQLQSFLQNQDKRRKEVGQKPISQEAKQALVEQFKGTSARQCEQQLAQLAPESVLPREKVRAITEDAFLLQFTVHQGLLSKINQLKALWSNQNPEGNMEKLLEKLVDMALEKADPIQKKPKKQGVLPKSEVKQGYSRYIPKSLRVRIWQRDRGQCQYRDPKSGRICRSNHLLEIDHVYPLALRGENSPDNLRLLCRSHNQYRQERLEAMGSRRGI